MFTILRLRSRTPNLRDAAGEVEVNGVCGTQKSIKISAFPWGKETRLKKGSPTNSPAT